MLGPYELIGFSEFVVRDLVRASTANAIYEYYHCVYERCFDGMWNGVNRVSAINIDTATRYALLFKSPGRERG